MAFQKWNLISSSPDHPFAGWNNFKDMTSLTHFTKMLSVTLGYTFLSVGGKMVLGLLIALLFNKKFFGRAFARGLMLVPWAMPSVVVCNVFLISLDPNYGILSKFLVNFGIQDVFSGKTSSFIAIILISIWKNFPFVSLMLLAAIGGISKDYYEAASIDGANNFVKFKKITWPAIKPLWNTLLVLEILWTVKEFELIYLITKGGPDNATNVIGIDIYLNAFRYYKVGLACAEGVLLLIFCLVFAIIYFRNINKEEKNE